MHETLNINLPKEEAANIAFHLINAQTEIDDSRDSMKYAKMIGGIVNLVRYLLGNNLNTKGIHYQRFITHIKFFTERYFNDEMLQDENEDMFEQIATLYPESIEISFKINDYIKKVYGKEIPKDELTYLAVHLNRLQSYNELSK